MTCWREATTSGERARQIRDGTARISSVEAGMGCAYKTGSTFYARFTMLRNSCLVASLLLLTASVGCDDDSSTTPTGMTVIMYQNTNYSGDSRALIQNAPDLDDYPGCGGAGADGNLAGAEVIGFHHLYLQALALQ